MRVVRSIILIAAVFLLAEGLALRAQPASRLARAREAAAQGAWKQAEDESRLHLQSHPGDEAAAVLHAQALFHLSQPFDAVLELEDYLQRFPNAVEAGKFYVALLVDVVRDRPKAMEVATRLSRAAPKDPQVWEALGKLQLGARKSADAVKSLSEALRLAPADPLIAVELAQALEENQQTARAAEQYRQAARLNAVRRHPNSRVFRLCADFFFNDAHYRESIPLYTQALLADPHDSDAWKGRAFAYEKIGDLRNAEADALATLREAPQRRDAHQLLLRIYRTMGQREKMEQQAAIIQKMAEEEQAALAANREMRDALTPAEQLLAARKYSEAIPLYERVIDIAPAFYEAYFALGVCFQQTGQTAKGEEALRMYLSFQPLSSDGHAALGLLLFAAGRRAEARPELEEAIRLNPALVEPRKALARLSLGKHDYAAAWAVLGPALAATNEPDAEVYALASQTRFSRGEKKQALSICETGLRAFPRDAALEELHAALLLDCGKTVECKQKALSSLQQAPSSPAYLKLVTALLIESSAIDPTTTDMVARMMQLLPDDPGALFLHAKWANAANQLDLALEEATRVAALPSATPTVKARAWALVAVTQDRLGHIDLAAAAFEKALALDRQLEFPDPEIALSYVDFLLTGGQDARADDLVAEILRWAPDYAPARLRHALRLARAGRNAEAIAEAQQVLSLSDDGTLLRAAHVLLAKTYTSLNRPADAKTHLDWISAH